MQELPSLRPDDRGLNPTTDLGAQRDASRETRRRHLDAAPVLVATAEVLGRSGQTKTQPLRGWRCRPASPAQRCTAGLPPRVNCSYASRRLRARDVRHRYRQGHSGLARDGKACDAALRFIVEYHSPTRGAACRHRAGGRHRAVVKIIPLMRAPAQLFQGPTVRSRPQRRFVLPCRTTSCAATTATSSWCSFATRLG